MIYDGPLAPFDLETTDKIPHTARIVTAFVGVQQHADEPLIAEHRWLVNPGVEIPQSAIEIHGITNEHTRTHGIDPAQAVVGIEALLASLVDRGIPIVVMNAPYDFTVLDAEIARHHAWRPLAFTPYPVLDPYVMDKAIDPFRKGKRTLSDLCELYGIPHGGAHDAAHDALAAARLVRVLLPLVAEHAAAGGWTDEIDLATLHAWQKSWRRKQTLGLLEFYRNREARDWAANPYSRVTAESEYRDEDFPTTWPIHERADAPDVMGETGVIYVCAACGMPIETEPCEQHQPRAYAETQG
jgi:DNA polymerase-3 subunit epsilon